jgi:hypothetical protein
MIGYARKTIVAVVAGTALLAGTAGSASAANNQNQDGLVNVAVGDVTILQDVNIGVAAQIAATICGVKVGPVAVLGPQRRHQDRLHDRPGAGHPHPELEALSRRARLPKPATGPARRGPLGGVSGVGRLSGLCAGCPAHCGGAPFRMPSDRATRKGRRHTSEGEHIR